jgi:hypothetical protein
VNVPPPALVQYVPALGAALLGQRRLDVIEAGPPAASEAAI